MASKVLSRIWEPGRRIENTIYTSVMAATLLFFGGHLIKYTTGKQAVIPKQVVSEQFIPEYDLEQMVNQGVSNIAMSDKAPLLCSDAIDKRVNNARDIEEKADTFAAEHGWEKFLPSYKSILYSESNLNMHKVSKKGAAELSQVMPKTFEDIPRMVAELKEAGIISKEYSFNHKWKSFLNSASVQVESGFIVYRYNVMKAYGNIKNALASYNAGPGNVRKAMTRAQAKGIKEYFLFDNYKGFLPKPKETIPYVDKTRAFSQVLKKKSLANAIIAIERPYIVNEFDKKADVLFNNGKYEQAKEHWMDIRKTAKRPYKMAKSDYFIGKCFESQGNHKVAADYYRTAQKHKIKEWNNNAKFALSRLKQKS